MSAPLAPAAVLVALALAVEPPPPEASSQLEVELERLDCDVWGGDGDNLPAIWTLIAVMTVHNRGDTPVVVDGGVWRAVIGEGMVRGRYRGQPLEIAAGEQATLISDGHLSLDNLARIRESTRTAAERTPRRLTGQLEFLHGVDRRYTPISAVSILKCGMETAEFPIPK